MIELHKPTNSDDHAILFSLLNFTGFSVIEPVVLLRKSSSNFTNLTVRPFSLSFLNTFWISKAYSRLTQQKTHLLSLNIQTQRPLQICFSLV